MSNGSEHQHSTDIVPVSQVSWRRPVKDIVLSTGTIPEPRVVADFDQLPVSQKIVEVLRYNMLSFERFVSPKGELRRWFQFNLRLLFFFAIPLVFAIPLLSLLIAVTLKGKTWAEIMAEFSAFLPVILENFARSLVIFLIGFSVAYCIMKIIKFHSHIAIQVILIVLGVVSIAFITYNWFLEDLIKYMLALF